ncbi:MAG: xanthine dehydrogenase family protein molybdopterin-binding subunit, partial [Candidatus Neomarinimicrobiota bacterium]
GVIIDDQPLLADPIVRYIGDCIGIVVAETEYSAYNLSKQVRITYSEQTPYLSIDDSKTARENFIHESNIACSHQVLKGNIEQGFQSASTIVEAEFTTPFQEHYYLEPQGCIAIPGNGEITIYGSLQCPYYIQKAISRMLGLPYNKVRVIQTPTGGAFGGKEDIPSEVCARAALAASKLNIPIKTVYQRVDDIVVTSKRHPFKMKYKVGVNSSRKLCAAEILLEENAGAYATLSSVVSYRSAMQAMGPYITPNIKVKSNSYYTNLPPTGAFRGFGSPQATFGHERMMDIVAEKIGMDPVEFRLRNILKPGFETQTGHLLEQSVGAEKTVTQAAAAAGWNDTRRKQKLDDRYLKGIGIAACHYGNCLGAAGWHMDGSGALVQIQRDGNINVSYGLVDMGQGAITVITQMTAEALGIHPDRITVLPTDSSKVPDSGPSVASRNVIMTGNAIRDAVKKLIPDLKSAAADLLGCDQKNIEFVNDKATNKESGDSVPFTQLAEYLYAHKSKTESSGWWHVPSLDYDPEMGLGEAYFTYSYGTQVAAVSVDTLTGIVKVEHVWAAHDVGRAINPAGIEGQIEGGVVQGAGWALSENFILKAAEIKTTNLSTYLLPTTVDSPDIHTIIIEEPEKEGPWGAKGVGEPSIIPTAAAVVNAVCDAVGHQFTSIPLVPEHVLDVIDERKTREQ